MCGCANKVKYISPSLNIDVPEAPKLYKDIIPNYNSKTDKIEYDKVQAAKLLANIKLLTSDNEALRIRLTGIKEAINYFKQVNDK
jgi:hypothetical protein